MVGLGTGTGQKTGKTKGMVDKNNFCVFPNIFYDIISMLL